MEGFDYELLINEYEITDYEKRYLLAVNYMIDNNSSLRRTASDMLVYKSTLHNFIHNKLPSISIEAYDLVIRLLNRNKAECNNFIRFPRPEPKYHKANIYGSNWQ